MDYQAYLIKAIAAERHFWLRIDTKYVEIGNFSAKRKTKILNIINELPPLAGLRAIKLLIINDYGQEGRDFVADLVGKVFKAEINYVVEHKDKLKFEEYLLAFGGISADMNRITRLASIYIHVRRCIGLSDDTSPLLLDIAKQQASIDRQIVATSAAKKTAEQWLAAHENIGTLSELVCDESLFTSEFFPLELVSKSENIPMRAYESYAITKKEVAELVQIANEFQKPYDLNRYLTTAFILKSLAKYAEECKNAYLDIALSPAVGPNKSTKTVIMRLEAALEQKEKEAERQQERLNAAQLNFDKLLKKYTNKEKELEELEEYTATLEAQLVVADSQSDDDFTAPDFTGKKVVVAGGHENWQKNLKERFPDFTFIGAEQVNFDSAITESADLIIFNFGHSSHKMFYRLQNSCNKDKIVFTATTNIDALLRQLAKRDFDK